MKREHLHRRQGSSRSRRAFLGTALSGAVGAMLVPRLAVAFGRATTPAPSVERAIYTMGSVLHLTTYADSRSHGLHALSLVCGEFRRLEKLLSVYDDASEISAINRSAGKEAVRVSQETFDAIDSAMGYARITGGAFTPLVEPLMRAWGFRSPDRLPARMPSTEDLTALVRAVAAGSVSLSGSGQSVGLTTSESALDLGGIGVGFAIDRAINILRREGIDAAFINHCGDAYALGQPPESDGWEVGIPDPAEPSSFLHSFRIRDEAIATSAAYERYIEIDGTRYGHVLDPARGQPANPHTSVTVRAASSSRADAISTALFCVAPREQMASLARGSGIEAIIVDAGPDGSSESWRCGFQRRVS